MKQIIKYTCGLILILTTFSCDKLDISSIQADSFIKLYGSGSKEIGVDVKSFNNGYILLATTTHPNREDTDIVLIKTDKYGNQKGDVDTIDSGGDDVAGKLLLTDDGGFIIIGTISDTTNRISDDVNNLDYKKFYQDIYIAKYNSGGEIDWRDTVGVKDVNEQAKAIKKAQTGYIIAGSTDRNGSRDVYLVKIYDSGVFDWDNTFGGDKDDYASDIIMHADGYLIIGTSNGYDSFTGLGKFDILLIKTNFTGGETHSHVYGGIYNDYGNSVVETNDGFVFTGSKENIIGDDADIYVAKIDKENLLEIIWNKSFGDNLYDQGFDILKNENGFTVAGNYEISNGTSAAYFLNIDSEGNELFENILGSYNQSVNSIERISDGSYIMIGNSGQEGNEMICLMKLNNDGEL
ncbi:MAG: hypothetical protein GQ564_07550 [Bacteroidales bacterium]|nr:hypothetical protein [Bacteroidales bacterium]